MQREKKHVDMHRLLSTRFFLLAYDKHTSKNKSPSDCVLTGFSMRKSSRSNYFLEAFFAGAAFLSAAFFAEGFSFNSVLMTEDCLKATAF